VTVRAVALTAVLSAAVMLIVPVTARAGTVNVTVVGGRDDDGGRDRSDLDDRVGAAGFGSTLKIAALTPRADPRS
jgi:hypothetical protein